MRRPSSYRLFLTKNSEYHVRGSVCCGVRDRRTGRWLETHAALGHPLAEAYRDGHGRVRAASIPMIGEPLVFVVAGRPIETSSVLGIEEREGLALGTDPESLAHTVSRRRQTRPRRVTHDTYFK